MKYTLLLKPMLTISLLASLVGFSQPGYSKKTVPFPPADWIDISPGVSQENVDKAIEGLSSSDIGPFLIRQLHEDTKVSFSGVFLPKEIIFVAAVDDKLPDESKIEQDLMNRGILKKDMIKLNGNQTARLQIKFDIDEKNSTKILMYFPSTEKPIGLVCSVLKKEAELPENDCDAMAKAWAEHSLPKRGWLKQTGDMLKRTKPLLQKMEGRIKAWFKK